MNVVTRLFNALVSPPLWPYGFVVANAMFAGIAIFSIYTLAVDQHAATQAYKLQAKAFDDYRHAFRTANQRRMKAISLIAEKVGVPKHEIDALNQPEDSSKIGD